MKIIILAAGDSSRNFPLLFDKPKCLYHYLGSVQIDRPINLARQFCEDKDIYIVAGYKADKVIDYIKENFPSIRVLVNKRYKEPAIYSYRTALQLGQDDYVFLNADESVKPKNFEKVVKSQKKLALLSHDKYYYYSLGFFKIRRDAICIFDDDCDLSMDYMKNIYCFANQKTDYDGDFRINDGVCMGYSIIDFVRRIGEIDKIEDPRFLDDNPNVDFFNYDPKLDYVPDLDRYDLTDEYKNSFMKRFYSDCISNNIKRVHRHLVKDSKFK